MMKTKYNLEVDKDTLNRCLRKNINLIYKLLPMREEGQDWIKPLQTIIEEFVGMNALLIDLQPALFPVICKLEGLFSLVNDEDMPLYRRTIFECLALLGKISI